MLAPTILSLSSRVGTNDHRGRASPGAAGPGSPALDTRARVAHTAYMERRRETTRVRAAERPSGAALVAVAIALAALIVVVLTIVPR